MNVEASPDSVMHLLPVCLDTGETYPMIPESHSQSLRNRVSLTRSIIFRRFPSCQTRSETHCCGPSSIQNA